jgi:hypothetical protein
MSLLEPVLKLGSMMSGINSATDETKDPASRVMGGIGAAGTGLTMAGTAATGATVAGAGGLSVGSVGSIVASGGAAGAGMGALATGGVLASGAAGYAAGSAFDTFGGNVLGWMGSTEEVQQRGVGAGTKTVTNSRDLSDRIAGSYEDQSDFGRGLAESASPYMPQWLGGDGWW